MRNNIDNCYSIREEGGVEKSKGLRTLGNTLFQKTDKGYRHGKYCASGRTAVIIVIFLSRTFLMISAIIPVNYFSP